MTLAAVTQTFTGTFTGTWAATETDEIPPHGEDIAHLSGVFTGTVDGSPIGTAVFTAFGQLALQSNTSGNNNIALGMLAGTFLTTGSNNIDIGNFGVADEGNTIRVGKAGTQTNTYVAGISGVTVPGGVGVIVDTNGHLGTVVSSERCKEAIKPMDRASEAILALKPVTFRYKHELDPEGILQFGLVAEQVERVDPDLVACDGDGKPYTVRYEAVNAMLLNEFLKVHRKMEDQASINQQQDATIADLESQLQGVTSILKAATSPTTVEQQRKDFEATIAQLRSTEAKQRKQIEALATGLRKVSDQLEMSNPPRRLAANK